MNVVVDASAAVEYLLRTETGERASLLADAETIFAPELLDAEVLEILRRLVSAKVLKKSRASQAVADLAQWPVQRLSHRELLADAWSLREYVSASDAMYVSAARKQGAILVTADAHLSQAQGLGVMLQNLRG